MQDNHIGEIAWEYRRYSDRYRGARVVSPDLYPNDAETVIGQKSLGSLLDWLGGLSEESTTYTRDKSQQSFHAHTDY